MKIKLFEMPYYDEDEINDYIKNKKIIDIKFIKGINFEKLLIMYEE